MKDIKNSFYKLTKKQVEDFDKKYQGNIEKNFLLKGRKWKLIGDTYYEIPPKLFSIGWFKNLTKGYKIATCSFLGVALAAGVAIPTAIALDNSKNKHYKKEVTYTSWKYDDVKIKGDFFTKNPYVFYIPVIDYNEYVPDSLMRVIDVDDDTVELKNLQSKYPDEKAKLNMKTGELYFPSFSHFTSTSKYPHQEIYYPDYSEDTGESGFIEGYTPKSFTINLNDYNLKPIKDGNTYYIPLDVMIAIDPTMVPYTAYCDDHDRVVMVTPTFPQGLDLVTSYPSSFYNFSYDLFTLNIDLYYGLNGYGRYQRYNDSYFVFNKDGARKTFEPYKNKLLSSKSLAEFDTTIDKMICEQLDDGGHTGTNHISFATDPSELPSDFGMGKENANTSKRLKEEREKRASAPDTEFMSENVHAFDTDGDGYGDIGYLYFNSFDVPSSVAIKSANSYFNKNAGEHEEAEYITDVVIDIACNGGGSCALEGVLLSWICNGIGRQVLKDARDGSVVKASYKYDLNEDGTCGGIQDYLPEDVHVYILTDATFSAASALAFDAYMYKESSYCPSDKKITFMGMPYLGGACSVKGPIILPTGYQFQISSTAVGVYWNDYTKTCDELNNDYIEDKWKMSNVGQIVNRTKYINPLIVAERAS